MATKILLWYFVAFFDSLECSVSSSLNAVDDIEWEDQGHFGPTSDNLFGSAHEAGTGRIQNAPAAGRARVGARGEDNNLVIRINTCVKYVSCWNHTDSGLQCSF